MHNGKYQWRKQAAYITYQLSSPSCLTRAIQKKPSPYWKMSENFLKKGQENGPLSEKWQDRKNKMTMHKNKSGGI